MLSFSGQRDEQVQNQPPEAGISLFTTMNKYFLLPQSTQILVSAYFDNNQFVSQKATVIQLRWVHSHNNKGQIQIRKPEKKLA